MKTIEFNMFGIDAVELRFECDVCGASVISDELSVPIPDFQAEKARDSQVVKDEYARCTECDKGFEISFGVGYAGGNITIHDLAEDIRVEVVEIPETFDDYDDYDDFYFAAIISNSEFHETFLNEIEKLKNLNQLEIKDPSLRRTLQGHVYVGVITCLETYLSDAFVNTVLSQDTYLRAFFKTFKDFSNQKFELNNLFDYVDKIKERAKAAMLGVLYHNLPKVRGMYQDTFGIKFPIISDVHKATMIRHDLVHRNGKTKDGEKVHIDSETVDDLIKTVKAFVNQIEYQLQEANDEMLYSLSGTESIDEEDNIPF
jgi:hypothetical protein